MEINGFHCKYDSQHKEAIIYIDIYVVIEREMKQGQR